ncbi:MAG: transposase [Candidatus Paceibacterota bacterium]
MHTQDTKDRIKESIRQTKEKRKSQECHVFELKIDNSHMNDEQKKCLDMWFLEAKRLYNYILALDDPFKYNTKTTNITVMNREGELEPTTLSYLPYGIRHAIHKGLTFSIICLSKKKNKSSVGALKFKSYYNTIEMNCEMFQIRNGTVKLRKIDKPFKVYGLHQITDEYETANAKLIKKASGYYIKVTCYRPIQSKAVYNKDVGLDFGIKHTITTSDGAMYDVKVKEPDTLKRLQKKLARQVRGSNNWYKTINKINLKYEKMGNIKRDKANKIINILKSNYDSIYIQDENLAEWVRDGRFSKGVQHSALGTIKSKLIKRKDVGVIDKYYKSTKECYQCGRINEIPVEVRTYRCECGLVEDVDIKSAKTILYAGRKLVPVGCREFKPVESVITQ